MRASFHLIVRLAVAIIAVALFAVAYLIALTFEAPNVRTTTR